MGRFQDVGALALVGDGHVGRGGAVLAGCRSRPGIGDVDAAGLGCPHGKTDEYDGSKSEEESDANLEDTELGQPEHFASLQSGAGMAAPASNPFPGGLLFPLFMTGRRPCLAPWWRVWLPSLWWFLTVGNEGMHVGVSPLPCGILAWRSGGDGAALLSDDGVLLIVGTALL